MQVIHRLRAYHAALALLAFGAYLASEAGIIHVWLGYGVVAVIVIRIMMALTGGRALGFAKYIPHFAGLTPANAHKHPAIGRSLVFGIALCLVGVAGTGITMDKGRALGIGGPNTADTAITATAVPDGDSHTRDREHRHDRDHEEGFLEETHETFGNALMFLVAAHVGYVLLFRLPMARFMLFMAPRRKPAGDKSTDGRMA